MDMSSVNKFLLHAAGAILVATMAMAVLNMILRPFGHPITGSFELMGFGSAMVTALGLGFSLEKKAHISVDILFDRLPRQLRRCLALLGQVVCGLFFMAISMKMFSLSVNFMENGELSETLEIPFYPVTMIVSAGIFCLSLNMFLRAWKTFFQARGQTGQR